MPEDSILIRSFRRKEAKLSSQQSGYGSDEDYPESTYDAQTDDIKGRLGLNLLYSPPEPLIDFVFVHGLGGGSRKTWSKTGSISHYWPQEWLPKDPSFKDVRVLSFGYESDWLGEKNNCFNIHHFAKLLLGELSTSPYLRESDTHIVFIAHSMGGLITKKAYLLARHDAFYDTLIKRFRAMCFFATPHLGSDLAKLLGKFLGITHSSLAYVSDLKRGSEALQSINDEFRKYSDKIDLCSFYEMQKVKVGPLSVRIVHPESATLGFGEEQQIPLLADHRSICKFETPEDPNYILVRNKLESFVHKFSELVLNSKKSLLREQIKDLESYLGVSGNQEDDLIIVEESRIRGTCEWLRSKNSYMKWKDFEVDIPNVLWVNGKPATGKSVLAGYAISELRKSTANCSFHFFKYGDNSKSRLSGCLRSLVFQMACTNAQVREVLLRMRTDGVTLDSNDERILWRKLLLSGIFQNLQGHYWVIDGLDECLNVSSFFSSVLAKLDKSIRLRILVTSRDTPEIEKNFCSLGVNTFVSEIVSTADTLLDIKALVEAKVQSLVVKDSSDRAVLVDKILKKSQGSFLWTVLVLNELSDSYTEQETSQVLEDVPRGMEPLYQRSLESMSQVTRGKKLSKAVLTWITCATRPLKISELHGALKLDIQDNFPKLQESILVLCGQLVTVDKFGRAQVLHETVREFLLRTDLKSEFAIIKEEAHTQIARACLTYLTGNEMKPPRTARRGNANSAIVTRTEFSNYACLEFSYHLSKASPFANDVLLLVEKFLKSNILSWIEVIARSKDVTPLVRTAKNLKIYLNSCAVQRSPLGSEMQTIKGWTTDLIRIAAKFADALIISPSAIYSLIVPFCPRDSTVYKTVGTGRMLSVIGLSESQWDDRLACIEFHQGQTTAICYEDEFFAVGLSSGNVVLYQATSCQVHRFMDHGEAVKFLQISSKLNLIASCGLKMIRVWNIRNSQLVHTFQSPQRPIIMSFHTNLLIVASAKNYLASWDVENNGAQRPHRSWNGPDEMNVQSYHTPCAISISHGHQMLAVAYSGRPIMLWDLEEDAYYGSCGKKLPNGETSTHFVTALVFNPNPAIDRLVASYLDGDLVLIDPFQDQVLVSFRADCHILAASLDGRLLAGAAGSGTIQIYEFDTLTLLYRVQASDFYIKQLAFGHDGLHFADIRGSQLNIWQPTVLLRDLVSDDVSECTSTSVIEGVATDPKVKISAMVVHPNGEALFCGKDDGSVCIYDLKSGIQLQILYRHKSLVHTLTWWPHREILMSVDLSNKIQAWSLIKSSHGEWRAEVSFQSRLDCGKAITQVLSSDAAEKFILSTRETDHLWRVTGQQEDMRSYSDRPGIRRWLQHQQSPLHVICFEGPVARIYAWSDWSEVISVALKLDLFGMQVKNVIPYISETKKLVLLETLELDGAANTCGLYLLDSSLFAIDSKSLHEAEYTRADIENPADMASQLIKGIEIGAVPEPLLRKKLNTLSHSVSHVIGLSATSRIVFLDTHSWVSSFSLHSCKEESQTVYLRHFFVPYDWFSGARHIISSITQRDILFAQNDDVVIIRGGLEDAQAVSVIARGSEV